MTIQLNNTKDLLSPPGDTIQETIDTIGMSQAELAERIGRPKEKLNALIKGTEPLTLKTAILLERVLGIPAGFWIERERGYQLELSKIEQQEFQKVLGKIKTLVLEQPVDYLNQLQQICAKCGVAVLYTPCLPKAPIAGATWWKGNNPIIQLSGRYKTNDSFWFAFYHEAGHILKHGKKEIFLENVEGNQVDVAKEKEADEFAQKQLFPDVALKRLKEIFDLKEFDIKEFAAMYETHPAIIVGQLQHLQVIDHSKFNYLKVPISIMNN